MKLINQDVTESYSRIKSFIHKTPVLQSSLVNELIGTEVHFKCENFQRAGAYKIRGATNAILQLSDNQKKHGVVTHSSGNFAQALSLAAKSIELPAYIVMPSNAPKVKRNAVKQYGGSIIECEPTIEARQHTADKISKDTGATFIHPSNDPNVIVGQGTAAIELLKDHPDLDCIICPVGGGGLIAGTILAGRQLAPNCEIIGAEPFEVDDAYRSLISGKIESNLSTNTIADGLRTQLGTNNFPIIKDGVSRIIRVTESEIIEAMKFIWERMKIIIEPSSAVAFAALIKEKDTFRSKQVGIIISGGNVDVASLPF